jgi:hypothetical protein
MLSKCANPSCSTPLIYLREGKIFMMEHTPGPETARTPGQSTQPSTPRTEHFWLCGPCSAELTLAYNKQGGVLVLPKVPKKMRAAS